MIQMYWRNPVVRPQVTSVLISARKTEYAFAFSRGPLYLNEFLFCVKTEKKKWFSGPDGYKWFGEYFNGFKQVSVCAVTF